MKSTESQRRANKKWRDKNPDKVRERNKRTRDARGKAKHREEMRVWRVANPSAAKSADLKKNYGIGIDEYNVLLMKQAGVCAVCGTAPGKVALAVDHCHETGIVRGLLCSPCNTALGLLRECPTRIMLLRDYIGRYNWIKP